MSRRIEIHEIQANEQNVRLLREAVSAINGLLKVAQITMWGTDFENDSRVQKAKRLLRKLKGQPVGQLAK